jgi:glycosyltransferase involved in cell wall biosynthesis
VAYTLLQCWHRVPGGTATSILRLGEAMAASGGVDLVGVGPIGRRMPPPPWTPTIPVKRLPAPYQLIYDLWHRAHWPPVQRATGRVDVVHATTTMVPPSGGVPLAVTVHDLFPLTDPDRFTPRGVRLLTAGIDAARRSADLVLCPSQATADDCLAHGFGADRIRVIPWGTTPVVVTPGDIERVRRIHHLERPYVLWVGTVEPRKNVGTLIDAFAALGRHDIDLVLVGPDGWNEDLGARVAAVGDRVHRLGFVADADLTALYAGAAAFCFPSLREGFGLPVLEAMAAGAPVVASNDAAVAEVAGDAAVLVDPTDHDGWVEALRAVLDDAALASRLVTAGRDRAAHFTWESAAAATIDAYRSVLP